MDIRTYLVIARRWWWTLLAAVVAAATAGYFGAQSVDPTYEAEARILVGPINTDIDTLRASGALSETYAQLVMSDQAASSVREELGLSTPMDLLLESIRATADSTTRILTIQAHSDDPDGAASIANALVDQLIELQAAGTIREEGELTIVDLATPPVEPVAPDVTLLTLMAAGAGLIAALLLVLGIEYLSDTFSSQYEVVSAMGEAPLGTVTAPSRFRPTPAHPLIVESLPESRAAAAYRLLASKVSVAPNGNPVRSLLIVGCQPGDSAGEVAANVAAVLARAGRSVMLIDANDVEGKITAMFSAPERPGMRELFFGAEPTDLVVLIQEMALRRKPGIDLVPRGSPGSYLIDIERARHFLEAVHSVADMAVINAAPVHRSGSTLVWARTAQASLVMVERDLARRENLVHALDGLRFVGASLLGVVMYERRWSLFERLRSDSRRDGALATPENADQAHLNVPEMRIGDRATPTGGATTGSKKR